MSFASLLRLFRLVAHAAQVFDAASADCGADQFVLALEALSKGTFAKPGGDQIIIGRASARENRSTDIDE